MKKLILFLLGYLINNANFCCKFNDNSVIITIFAVSFKCIYVLRVFVYETYRLIIHIDSYII